MREIPKSSNSSFKDLLTKSRNPDDSRVLVLACLRRPRLRRRIRRERERLEFRIDRSYAAIRSRFRRRADVRHPFGDIEHHALTNHHANIRSTVPPAGTRREHLQRRSGKRHGDAPSASCTRNRQPRAAEVTRRSVKGSIQVAVDLEPKLAAVARFPASCPQHESPQATLAPRRPTERSRKALLNCPYGAQRGERPVPIAVPAPI